MARLLVSLPWLDVCLDFPLRKPLLDPWKDRSQAPALAGLDLGLALPPGDLRVALPLSPIALPPPLPERRLPPQSPQHMLADLGLMKDLF
ncbi:uncharacterized protein FFB14_08539 [Fusarium fujikuroi]|nr:uncharacterized protein FFB14_08539 [Fusarium fujikuroi]